MAQAEATVEKPRQEGFQLANGNVKRYFSPNRFLRGRLLKLRIRGNSIRLRLQKSEVDTFKTHGVVEDSVRLGPDPSQCLKYALYVDSRRGDGDDQIMTTWKDSALEVRVPSCLASQWTDTPLVSLVGELQYGDGGFTRILIEKDYQCINPNRVWPEDESDAFPNPNPSCGGAISL